MKMYCKNMTKKAHFTFIAAACITIIAAGILLKVISNAAVTNANKIEIPPYDTSQETGTEGNPFVVLEIVPYEGFAELGYLVAGQEPVDMKRLSWSSDWGGTIGSLQAISAEQEYIQTFEPSDEMLSLGKVSSYERDEYGYYEKVEDGLGDFIQVVDSTKWDDPDYITDAHYEEVTDGSGNYIWHGYGPTVYNDSVATDHNSNEVHTRRKRMLYQANHYEFTNKNWFLKECLKIDEENIADYHIRVVTVTPNQLNQNLELIDRANLIYITDRSHDQNLVKLWQDENYRRTDMFSYSDVKSNNYDFNSLRFTNEGNDLSWEAVIRILQKKSGCDLEANINQCPIVYDVGCISQAQNQGASISGSKLSKNGISIECNGTGSENNVYKLGLFLIQGDTADLYEMYIKSGIIQSTVREDGLTTGKFTEITRASQSKEDPATWWTLYTLIPYQLVDYLNYNYSQFFADIKALGYRGYDWSGSNMFIASNGLYTYNSDNSMIRDFMTPGIDNTDTTSDAFDYYDNQHHKLSPAQVISYLLAQIKTRTVIDSMRILEIQPSDSFKSEDEWKFYLAKAFPDNTITFTVEQQTSKEFICSTKDLAKNYDLIYLGTEPGMISSEEYNDSNLNGLLYMHVGDRISPLDTFSSFFGLKQIFSEWGISNPVISNRLSGNDITKLKMQEIKDYVAGGHIFVVGKGCYLDTKTDNKKVNSNIIDSASNVYQLLLYYEDSSEIYCEELGAQSGLEEKLTASYCRLTLSKQPKAYQDIITAAEEGVEVTPQEAYITQNKVTYEFMITDLVSDQKYQISLRFDRDHDQILEESELIELDSVTDVAGKSRVSSNGIVSNTIYRFSVDVSDLVGIVPWELNVVRLDSSENETKIVAASSGSFAVKASGSTEKNTIRILQVVGDSTWEAIPGILLPTDEEVQAFLSSYTGDLNDPQAVADGFYGIVKQTNGWRASKSLARVTGLIYYYTRNLSDYQITFDRISEFELKFKLFWNSINLEEYDMLVLGFGYESMNVFSNRTSKAIESYVNNGNPVIFTYNSTYYLSANKLITISRDMMGMDRYGLSMHLDGSSLSECIASGKDAVYKPRTSQSIDNIEEASMLGYTDQMIYEYALDERYHKEQDQLLTKTITLTNAGTISEYPYAIPDNLTIAPTCAQYYQLDLEKKDMKVWYCLSDTDSNDAYEYNDGRNGYYLYTNGNITYSGIGNSNAYGSAQNTTGEVKLFINTMIASYRSAARIKTEITNTDMTTDSLGHNYLYVDYDSENTEVALGNGISQSGTDQYKKIEYKIINESSEASSKLNVSYWLIPLDDTLASDEDNWEELDLVTYRNNNSSISNDALETNQSYYVKLPLAALKNADRIRIGIKLSTTGKTKDKVIDEITQVMVLRRGLFNLD